MVLGEYASPMAHGLGLKDWWLLERTITIVLAFAKHVIFCCLSNQLLVVGARVTFHVRTRLRFYIYSYYCCCGIQILYIYMCIQLLLLLNIESRVKGNNFPISCQNRGAGIQCTHPSCSSVSFSSSFVAPVYYLLLETLVVLSVTHIGSRVKGNNVPITSQNRGAGMQCIHPSCSRVSFSSSFVAPVYCFLLETSVVLSVTHISCQCL